MDPLPANSAPPVAWSQPDEALADPDSATEPLAPPRITPPGHLTPGWRWTLGVAWAGVMSAIGLIADTGVSLGGPPFWLVTGVLPFILPAVTLFALFRDWRHALLLSFVSTAGLAVIGIIDLFVAPAIGLAELVVALAALLISLAGLGGRVPPVEQPVEQPAVEHTSPEI